MAKLKRERTLQTVQISSHKLSRSWTNWERALELAKKKKRDLEDLRAISGSYKALAFVNLGLIIVSINFSSSSNCK